MPMLVLVDDNQESRAALERTLAAQGYAVQSVATLDEARQWNGGSGRLPVLLVGLTGSPAPSLSMREVEKLAIEAALRANQGNRTHAARQLGISLRKLQYRLKEYGRQAEPVMPAPEDQKSTRKPI